MIDVQPLLGRKGATRIALIAPPVLDALNEGLIETVNLNEFLAIDLARLTTRVADQVGLDPDHERLHDTLAMLDAFKPIKRHLHVARALYDLTAAHPQRDAIAHRLANHANDVARCWAAQWLMFPAQSLPDKLQAVRRFAADRHFGVREVAGMVLRDPLAGALDEGLLLLQPWVRDPDENIRRFASELTRPRGVWCAQIEALKAEPWRALGLLEPLRADPSRYVQNSVANWLNDASKSQPQWVGQLGERWLVESDAPQTRYIVRRALRALSKQ